VCDLRAEILHGHARSSRPRANDALAPFHDRAPAVIPREAYDRWLDTMAFDVPAVAPQVQTRPTPVIRAERIDVVR
jgi:putative SOS response-associated peptidase YedK